MTNSHQQSGFTAVELLITLFVAAAFLVSGYQLFNVVIKDGGKTRAESRASNVAYDYLRRYGPAATSSCTPGDAFPTTAVTVTGLSAVTVKVAITCPFAAVASISKIEATVLYNTPQQTMKYSTYVRN